MKWFLGIFGVAVVLVVVLIGRGTLHGSNGTAIDPQLVVKVHKGDLDVIVTETGKVEPKAKAEIKSKVAGQVLQVFVKEGETVRSGQKLIQLDPIDYRRDVERAQADMEQARVQQEYATGQLERREKALAGRGISQSEFEAAKNEVAVAKARIALASVALRTAQDKLHYTTITAPMEGVVIQRGIEPGEVVTPGIAATFEGKPLLVVADLSELKVKVNLNQIDVARVSLGQNVDVSVDALAGHKFHARVTKVAPAAVLERGKEVETFPVEATLDHLDGCGRPDPAVAKGARPGPQLASMGAPALAACDIKPGMTADVKVRVSRKPGVLLLPIEAVTTQRARQFGREIGAEKNWVFVIDRQGGAAHTRRVDVEVGERNDREAEILRGVPEGQEVLIQPPSAEANEVKM
jgi:RND family efflux transporter MFP subunit